MGDRTRPDAALPEGIPEVIDEAIDRAVREMMNVEPRAGLRQRVLDEIAGPRRVMPWRALASASAALAAIVLLVVTLITRQPAPSESRVATTRVDAPAAQPTTPRQVTPPPEQVTPPPEADPTIAGASPVVRRDPSLIARRPGRVPPPGAQERLVEAASIPGALALEPSTAPAEPLAPILPVALTPLATPAIRTSEIEIATITLDRLEIVPLPSRR